MNNSKILFKDNKNNLRTLDFGNSTLNLHAIKNQKQLKGDISELGMQVKDKTPVLCLLYTS